MGLDATTSKAIGDGGITVELLQVLKDDAVKVLHSVCLQIWKTPQWPQDWKRSVFIPIPKKDMPQSLLNFEESQIGGKSHFTLQ